VGVLQPIRRTESGRKPPDRGDARGVPGRSGFARFFEDEWPRLRLYLKRLVGAQDAEDIAQEAFTRLYAAPGEIRSPSGMLYQTARNLVVDEKRRAGRAQAFLIEDAMADRIADASPSPEDVAHWRRRLDRAAAMLEKMSPKCRSVFLLRVIEDCSYAEIAERLNLSTVAVEKQLLRAFEICAAWNGEARRRRGTRAR
jgi:RNA polymerase sigma-70 factor (ECF subfamily)